MTVVSKSKERYILSKHIIRQQLHAQIEREIEKPTKPLPWSEFFKLQGLIAEAQFSCGDTPYSVTERGKL